MSYKGEFLNLFIEQVSNDEDHIILYQFVDGLDIPLQNTEWDQ